MYVNKAEMQKARDLIAKGWMRGGYAQDDQHNRVLAVDLVSGDHRAVCYCSLGGIIAAVKSKQLLDALHSDAEAYSLPGGVEALYAVVRKRFKPMSNRPYYAITQYNDTIAYSKADVLSAFDEAISLMED